MKQPALEKGSSDEAVSTIALLEAACEVFMPGGVSEQVSLQRFLRQLPVANSCKELLGTLRRWRLAKQRAEYLKIPEQAPHESIAAFDGLCRQLEKKHTLLGTRLSLMRLQHNIQVPTHDGVSSYLQILEAECTRIFAEEQTASRGGPKHGDVGEYDMPAANQAAGGKGVKPLCAYYNTARGCLKGSDCTFRHEKQGGTSQKGKGAQGKDGKNGKGDKGATKSAEPKAKAKAEAKAAADATPTPSARAKTKAEKKAAKAAAKAASSTAAVAQEFEDVPALAGAACAAQESSSRPCAMMASNLNDEPDSDSDSDNNPSISGIPMRADGDTPEWSEVERGEFSSEEAESEGSDVLLNFQQQPEPLWTLELSVTEYMQWRRPGFVHSRASHEFVETTNPRSICWPLWWSILHDELDENEQGTIPVVDGVDILQCDIALVMFDDQIARPVFLVWLLEEETGNERYVAIIRHRQRPVVIPEEEPERSQAAPPRIAGASSARPRPATPPPRLGYPVTPLAKATAKNLRAGDARNLVFAEATAEAFESGLLVSDDEESYHFSQASADQDSSEAHPSSSDGPPTAMRCVEVEDQHDIPSLVGAKASVVASRLECMDCPVSNVAAESQTTEPSVLVDSGANETIRPWTKDINETGCRRTSVITASGDQVPALKTRDGELCIKASPTSKDWLLSVRRLVDAGGTFCWNQRGAVVSYVDQHGEKQSVRCSIQNGLPFLTWQDFKPIRIMLSRYFKTQSSSALSAKASGGDDGWTECETCTLEELMQYTWDDEVACVGAELKDEVIQNEAMARDVLSKGPITYQDVWEVIRSAALPTSSRRTQMWIFGYYCHGGIVGVTNLTRQRPNLCKLVNAFLQQELPDFTYAAFQIAVDATLAPHRDITNEVGSMSGLIGVTKFEGGRLWIEDRNGTVKRRISGDEIKVGKLLTVSQQACTFDARAWHGADRHKGVRCIITCYTPRCLHKGDLEVYQRLRDLNFNLPAQKPQQAPASTKQSTNRNTDATSHHISDSDDEDDDDDALVGFEGFLASGSSGRCRVCGVTLLSHALESIDPWTPCAVEEKPLGSSFDEAARERATQLLRSKCSQGLYERHCPKCSESAGHKRKSRRLSAEDVARGTLSLDLSGPHPESFSGHRYFLAANLSVDGDDIPFSRLLQTKQSSEVAKALVSVMVQIISLVQGTPSVFRIHSDAGKEFVGGAFLKEVESCSIWATTSAPYCPQQNGRAERLVGILKQAAGSLLLHAQLPLQLWNEAILEATFLRRCRAIGLVIPKDRPHMGDAVLVRKPSSTDAHPFAPKAEEGVFLANDERTPGGARVMVVRNGRNSVRVVRMPVLIDKQSARWRLEKGPQDQVVWISTCGDIRWDAPPADLITVEEATGTAQAWNDGNTASEIIRQRFNAHLKPELLFSLFGHGFLVGPELGELAVAAAGKQDEPFQEESKDNWYRVFDAGTEDAMNEMEIALRLLAEEEITGEPVPSSIFFTGTEQERQPWIKAAGDEVLNMTTNAAWVEVNISSAREELGLGPHERLPKVLPMTVVCTRKPLLMQDDKCEPSGDAGKVLGNKSLQAPQSASEVKALEQKRFKPKVRLCVCGNFEEVKPEMKDANAAETVPVEILRLMLTLLATHLSWSALSLDISAAFLNAVLTGKEVILMQPPKSLVKLGLIPEGVWLRAMRAIYGLRQSPARWEELRDSILDGAVLEAAAGDLLPTLVIQAMKGFGGVFLKTTRDAQQLVAVACVFVDDVLAIGETEAILRIGEFVLKSWKGRLQGMLSREPTQAWKRGTLEVKAKSELVFVGIQMFFHNGGVAMSQQRWVVKQLNVRGYLHLSGSPCLPQVEEGKVSKGDEKQCDPKLLKQAQRELGTLMWLATKTRPDIAATCGILSTMIVLRPDMVLQKVVGMWKYIRHTMFFWYLVCA